MIRENQIESAATDGRAKVVFVVHTNELAVETVGRERPVYQARVFRLVLEMQNDDALRLDHVASGNEK